ncbi:Protein CBG03737 [Caenorhabditis briggsae]|uniref:Protein CBG03737 n=1 Tax=Caenorhabditis briggsae TaxID=6238 RepID=A8WWL5_CAEBR|nr:Protein CBG03737 [Caenorhabditis briggsae]CAP24582.2 Protein CBG03737 [Caenorhabditis briggsae]
MSDLEVFISIPVPSSESSTSFFEKKNERWDDLTRCSCNQIHETIDDLFICAEMMNSETVDDTSNQVNFSAKTLSRLKP